MKKRGKKPIEIMGYYQENQYVQYESPRRRTKKPAKGLFKQTIAENIPNLEKEVDN
jgi:hypothetical protein